MKKADNFDATKWLVENKITTQSRLKEDESSPYYKLGYQIGPNGRRATVDTQSTEYNTIEKKANQLTSLLNDKDLIDFAKGSTDSIGSSRARYEGLQDVASSLLFFNEIKNRLGKSKLNEAEENEIEVSFKTSPKMLPWNAIEKAYQNSGLTGEEFFADVEDEFREKFEGKPVSKEAYYKFFTEQPNAEGQGDLYTMVNWINLTNPALADKLYSMI